MIILSYFIEGIRHSIVKSIAALSVVLGVGLAIPYGDTTATPTGLVLCILSTLSVALRTSLAALVMRVRDRKAHGLTPIAMVWYDCLFGTFWFAMAGAMAGETTKLVAFFSDDASRTTGILLAGSTLAFSYNFINFVYLDNTSSLTHSVTGAPFPNLANTSPPQADTCRCHPSCKPSHQAT